MQTNLEWTDGVASSQRWSGRRYQIYLHTRDGHHYVRGLCCTDCQFPVIYGSPALCKTVAEEWELVPPGPDLRGVKAQRVEDYRYCG